MKKILVIEDENYVREGIIELLEGEGYEVFSAENGRIGIELAEIHLPDLIICDVMMPELNGYEVLNILLQDQSTSTIPFVFLTAKTEKEDIRFCMELGADDYITKPFRAEELFKAINTRLKKQEINAFKSEQKLDELRLNIAKILPHELRTPLNGILASAQLLLEYYDSMDNEEVRQIHENIYTSAKRLNKLIANYLFFVELELLNKDESKLEVFKKYSLLFNPSYVINNIFTAVANNYKRVDDLIFNVKNSPIQIFEDHFLKICEEIADNAFKFSHFNFKVEVNSEIVDSYYLLKIKDNGRGLTKSQIDKIGAYIQFDRNIYEQQGSGLGLIIVKRLLDIYNAEININSVINQFTEVSLKIPLAAEDALQ